MEKYFIRLFLFSVAFFFTTTVKAQSEPTEVYHSEKTYNYPKYEDKDLTKAKTELFLTNLKKAGFRIDKNEIKEYEIDIDLSSTMPNKNIVKYNVVYMFFDSYYTVDLWNPKAYDAKTKKWIHLNKDIELHKTAIDNIEKIMFNMYENEMNSNF